MKLVVNKLHPSSGIFKYVDQFFLFAIGIRLVVVLPLNMRWKAHQNTFNPSIGFQSKKGAFVVDQIELYIAPPPNFLSLALGIRVVDVFPFFNDWHIGLQKTIPYPCHKVIPVFGRVFFVGFQIIKK